MNWKHRRSRLERPVQARTERHAAPVDAARLLDDVELRLEALMGHHVGVGHAGHRTPASVPPGREPVSIRRSG
jgi:hypothetical protein